MQLEERNGAVRRKKWCLMQLEESSSAVGRKMWCN